MHKDGLFTPTFLQFCCLFVAYLLLLHFILSYKTLIYSLIYSYYHILHRENECSEAELQRAVSSILEKGNMIINIANNERRKFNENLCD